MIGIGINTTLRAMGGGGGVAPFVGLLDTYPDAAAAYSLRKLSTAYTGSAIRVRRASDNAEQNIGFTALGNLDTTSLTTFCSGTNGFVTTWYDQSGNGYNATQTTATNQPQIVSSGSVITNSGKPCIQLDNINDSLKTILTINRPYSIYAQFLQSSSGGIRMLNSDNATNSLISSARPNNTVYTGGDVVASNYVGVNTNVIVSLIESIGTTNFYYNTNNITIPTPSNNNWGILCFGVGSTYNEQADGQIKECIVWLTDQTSNNTAIQTNINTYYGIY